jgi:hypothetical protein
LDQKWYIITYKYSQTLIISSFKDGPKQSINKNN